MAGFLLITDIIVELEDGTLANIEVQKIGYALPKNSPADDLPGCSFIALDLLSHLLFYKTVLSFKSKSHFPETSEFRQSPLPDPHP